MKGQTVMRIDTRHTGICIKGRIMRGWVGTSVGFARPYTFQKDLIHEKNIKNYNHKSSRNTLNIFIHYILDCLSRYLYCKSIGTFHILTLNSLYQQLARLTIYNRHVLNDANL